MKPGDMYPVWWATGKRDEHGTPLAKVIAVLPYRGRYPQYFNNVLRLHAPNTSSGALEMTVQL